MTLPQDPSLGTDCSTSRSWRRQETVFPRDREYNAVLHRLSFCPAPPVSHSNLRNNLIHFPCLFGYSQSSTRLHQVKRQHYMSNTEKAFYTGGGVSRSAHGSSRTGETQTPCRKGGKEGTATVHPQSTAWSDSPHLPLLREIRKYGVSLY